ncbi:serine/threonine-protein kinase [Haliangium sp.]|uniref:serine/threonine-protein kinase n=1 Tax=Haliangium sp. TaxID=2663208 RepID=UPI003D0E46BA
MDDPRDTEREADAPSPVRPLRGTERTSRVRVGQFVAELPAQHVTVLSAAATPAVDNDLTMVDGPLGLAHSRAHTDRDDTAPPVLMPFTEDFEDSGFELEDIDTLTSNIPELDELAGEDTTRHASAAPAVAPTVEAPVPRRPATPPPPPRAPGRVHATPARPAPPARSHPPASTPSPSSAVPARAPAGRNAPMVGDRYRVVERIGAGGMGKVFKVIHAQLGKTFALKIIRDNLAEQDKARDLFYREARLASSLSHPNIASVVDFGEDERLGAFMVMEFLQGEPLHRVLAREKRLGLRKAVDIIEQVAEALHYIHSKGIVHCDIKTENILMTEVRGAKRTTLQVTLLDFGLARSTAGTRSTNSLAGTPHYVAPERIRGRDATPAADIYGLGILFYEMLTGRVPWDGNVDEILAGHLNLAPTPPSKLIEGGLDAAIEKLILRALAKSPERRHESMASFLHELRAITDRLGYTRRRTSVRRAAVPQPTSAREEAARALFDACRVPMALISRKGIILVANPAFAQFVMGIAVDVEGMEVSATPLARVWTSFAADLDRASRGTSLRRTVELEVGHGDIRRLLLWLDPGLTDEQVIFGAHPLDG